jgi:hypothetical protein
LQNSGAFLSSIFGTVRVLMLTVNMVGCCIQQCNHKNSPILAIVWGYFVVGLWARQALEGAVGDVGVGDEGDFADDAVEVANGACELSNVEHGHAGWHGA